MDVKIGFIGCGNMGEAMLSGFINSSKINKENIFVYTKTEDSRNRIRTNYKINTERNNIEVVKKSDYIFLAVKPDLYKSILEEISPYLTKDKVLVSITPSFSLEELMKMINYHCSFIRTIPNTSSKYNLGFTSVVFNDDEDNYIKEGFLSLISILGGYIVINEEKIALLSTLSGSSPALIYMFADAFLKYGERNNLTYDESRMIFAKTLVGAAKMIENDDQDLMQLVDNVCSPNGSTIRGVNTLKEQNFSELVEKALDSITNRFIEMNKKS